MAHRASYRASYRASHRTTHRVTQLDVNVEKDGEISESEDEDTTHHDGHPPRKRKGMFRKNPTMRALVYRLLRKWKWLQSQCSMIMDNEIFQYAVLFMLSADLVNSVITIQLPVIFQDLSDDETTTAFLVLNSISVTLSISFLFELAVRFVVVVGTDEIWMVLAELGMVLSSGIDVLISLASNGAFKGYLIFARIIRILRILRFVKAVTQLSWRFQALQLIYDAVMRSLRPLALSIISELLLFVLVSIIISLQVPELANDFPNLNDMLLESFGSVEVTARTLVIAMSGSGEQGQVVMSLWQSARTGRFAPFVFLSTFLLSVFFLVLTSASLIAGIFMSALIVLKGEQSAVINEAVASKAADLLKELEEAFKKHGFETDSPILWSDVELAADAIFKNPLASLTYQDAHSIFREIDAVNNARVEDFLLNVYKTVTISKTVNMMAMDFQQQKVFANLQEYGFNLHDDMRTCQQRIWSLVSKLPELASETEAAGKELQQMLDLEALVCEKRAAIYQSQKLLSAAGEAPFVPSLVDLNSTTILRDQLHVLEEFFDKIERGGFDVHSLAAETALGTLGTELADRLKDLLEEELQIADGDVRAI